jgi:hypothetical protein
MTEIVSKAEILTNLKSAARRLGLTLHDENADGFKGDVESILVKWFLGQKKETYFMSVNVVEAERTVNFREAVKERSSGFLPPTLSVETTGVSGWERSGSKTEKALGSGGGTVDFGKVRSGLQQVIASGGWQFHLDGL